MPEDIFISDIVKGAPVLGPNDTVRRAASLIKSSEGSALCVQEGGRLVGFISEKSISSYIASAGEGKEALDEPIEMIVDRDVSYINPDMHAVEAASVFAKSQYDMLPAIDAYGGFRGVVFQKDVVALLTGNLRPKSVAGMATPLGVYLTTGSHSAGAGYIGLFLTGATLMAMMVVAHMASYGVIALYSAVTGHDLIPYLMSPPITIAPNVYDIPIYALFLLNGVFFALMLHYSPLSGYHAAEHMTVHAIEAGEEVSKNTVRGMPRVHARCGTNLLAAAVAFLLVLSTKFGGEFTVIIALLVVIVGWRAMGAWLQRVVTTKPPNERQLENGVETGKELLAAFQKSPNLQLTGFARIWRLGFLQTAAGMVLMFWLAMLLQDYANLPLLF